MAEIPDFDQFARRWCYSEDTDDVSDFEARIVEMVAELKAIWNARGVADVDAIDPALTFALGPTVAGPYVQIIKKEIRKLDY